MDDFPRSLSALDGNYPVRLRLNKSRSLLPLLIFLPISPYTQGGYDNVFSAFWPQGQKACEG